MVFVVRINRPDHGPGRRGWSTPLTLTRHRKLEDAQRCLEDEVWSGAGPTMSALRTMVLRVRARFAKPGEHIEAGDYDHWIEEEPDPK